MKKWTKIGMIVWLAMDIALFALGIVACKNMDKPDSSTGGISSGVESIMTDESEPPNDSGGTEDSTPSTPGTAVNYKITYYAVVITPQGEMQEAVSLEEYPELMVSGRSYPTSYKPNAKVRVDPLLEYTEIGERFDMTFMGWYADAACTIEYGQTVNFQTAGNLELYAKLQMGEWTKNY